jgi:hypothetical protein
MDHPDHNAFFELHRRREQLHRKAVLMSALNAAALIALLLTIGALIGMAVTTVAAMPALLSDAAIHARS